MSQRAQTSLSLSQVSVPLASIFFVCFNNCTFFFFFFSIVNVGVK